MKEEQMKEMDKKVADKLLNIKHKLLVMSGKGGVGKSTIAIATAVYLNISNYKVGLLDIDIHGPSVPRILGLEGFLNVSEDKEILPREILPDLYAVSIDFLLQDRNTPIIWRGPLKHTAIKQFIGDVKWGNLDFLVIDSPPGTGDEVLSIAQLIPDAKTIIVTTPQEVSLGVVRKAINFCREVKLEVLGIIENMSYLICPHCGGEIDIFGRGGGKEMAEKFKVDFLGELPMELELTKLSDKGEALKFLLKKEKSKYQENFERIIHNILKKLGK